MTRSLPLPLFVAAFAALASFLAFPTKAQAGNEYVNYMRSSTTTYIFVQEAVEGEYGRHVSSSATPAPAAGDTSTPSTPAASNSKGDWWQGVGFDTSIGLEVLKFFQLVAGHTFVNDRLSSDNGTTLTGSRLHAGGRLDFESPVCNLELGGGLLGSSMQYTAGADRGSFYGSGIYYSLGLNYFTSERVSFYYEAKFSNEHLVKSTGSTQVQSIDTSMTGMSLGFRLWLF